MPMVRATVPYIRIKKKNDRLQRKSRTTAAHLQAGMCGGGQSEWIGLPKAHNGTYVTEQVMRATYRRKKQSIRSR